MSRGNSLMSFAMNDCGGIVSVEHVDRGAACGCFCPACGEPVIAKQGDQKLWHFAHMSGTDCAHGSETALHKAAKQIIFDRRELVTPEFTVSASAPGRYSGRRYHVDATAPEALRQFDQVLLEQPMAFIVPDAVGIADGSKWLIEVVVTNPVSDDKLILIEQLNFPALEIVLQQEQHHHWTWEALYEEVIQNSANKRWLHYPNKAALAMQAQTSADAIAAAESPPETSPKTPRISAPSPVLTKLSFRGKPVRLTEYPFGMVAWSPYDPVINQILKCFGAKWQPRYKNWLLSSQVKTDLLKAFC